MSAVRRPAAKETKVHLDRESPRALDSGMSDPPPLLDFSPAPSDPWMLVCPQCRSIDLLAMGRVFANAAGVQGLYRCRRCLTETWLPCMVRRLGSCFSV